MSCFGLLGLASSASAQFQSHHQQVFVTGTDTRISAKALDLVPESSGGKYVFTGTYIPPVLDTVLYRPLLVKLGKNEPNANPFSVEWAMTYLFPGFGEPTDPSPYNLDVQDVHYVTDKGEYILCGSFNRGTYRIGGFLLRADANGYPIVFKFYNRIKILNSVVAKPNASSGYIAVGETKSNNNWNHAAVLSVTENLNVICVKRYFGRFVGPGRKIAKFNKVITYNDQKFAAVGDTTFFPNSDMMLQDTDVIVAVFDEQCGHVKRARYGHPSQFDPSTGEYIRYFEEGKSIARVGSGAGLVITGTTTKERIINNTSTRVFNDILLFRLRPNFNLRWMKHYDVQEDVDVGLAVQVRTIGNTRTVFVAGEARTSFFDTTGNVSPDVILLEARFLDGEPLGADLFGKDQWDGRLRGNVDLHLTPEEKFPLILANTNSWPLYGSSNPYLIERYDTISEKCNHAVPDLPDFEYDFPRGPARRKNFATDVGEEEVSGQEQSIGGKIVCDKIATV